MRQILRGTLIGWHRINRVTRRSGGLLEQDKDWIKLLAWCRNALDINHSKPRFKVEIENFKIHPGNKFSNPRWRYDFSGKNGATQSNFSDIIIDMHIHLSNMLTFFEELFVLCVRDNWDRGWNYEIFKRNEEDVDKKCPTLYFVSWKNESLRNETQKE